MTGTYETTKRRKEKCCVCLVSCYHHRHGSFLGRSLLLGTLLGLFMSRANQNRTEEED